jgi:cellulose/xylan binding protein with CBM9 domain
VEDSHKTIEAPFCAAQLNASDLQSPNWNRAAPLRIDHYWSGETAPRSRHAEARLLWSSKALHIRFKCHQEDPLVVSHKPQTVKKTMELWNRDVCEIFIAPDPHIVEQYFEFEVAPTGEWLDVAVDLTSGTRQSDWEFNSEMTAAATIEKGQVTMAMRIPWSRLIPRPQQGERWRVNLFRCVGKGPGRGYLAWQPTRTPEPLFHLPQAFGWLVFR